MQQDLISSPFLSRIFGSNESSLPRWVWILSWCAILLLALPSLMAPMDMDGALFYISGLKILDGQIPYRDFLDLKPPGIYYIYAAAIALFGEHGWSIRLLDLLIQTGTIALLVMMIRRVTRSDRWALLSGMMYALLYFSQLFIYMAQVECFANPLCIGIIWLLMQPRTSQRSTVIGLLIGGLFLLKTSFLAVAVVVVVVYLSESERSWKERLTWILSTAVGIIMIGIVFVAYLLIAGNFGDYGAMQQFVQGYASIQWANPFQLVQTGIREIPWYFSNTYSIFFSLLTLAGIAAVILNSTTTAASYRPSLQLLRYSTLIFLALLATIAVEAKYLSWHFCRLFAPGIILAGWGGTMLLQRLSQVHHTVTGWGIAGVMATLLLIFSPLTRYLHHNYGNYIFATKGEDAFDRYLQADSISYRYAEYQAVGEYIQQHREEDDHVFAASGAGGMVHFYANDLPETKFYHTCFLIAPYAPQQWRSEATAYLLTKRPRFVVAQNDAMPHITGNDTTSLQLLRSLPGVDSLLNNSYQIVYQTSMTQLYQRK